MFSKFLFWFRSLFKVSEPDYSTLPYIVVEAKTSDGGFQQAIRILPEQVVVIVSPKVKVEIIDEQLHVSFDFSIVSDPLMTNLTKLDIKQRVGDAIIDLMQKDYSSIVQNQEQDETF